MLYKVDKLSDKILADEIEKNLLHLSPDYLKIHLYLIKSGILGEEFSSDMIADQLGTTEKKVLTVMEEWREKGLLTEVGEKQPEDEELQLCLYFFSLFKGEDPDLSEISDITTIHEKYGIDSDLFSFITEYCSSKSKLHTGYMLKLAGDWSGRGIKTRSQAELMIENRDELLGTVKKAFGIKNRDLVPVEIELIETWKNYPLELVDLACKKAVIYTGKPNFKYTDAVLKDWEKKGIKTVAQAEMDQPPEKEKKGTPKKKVNDFHNFQQREYDYDELARLLMKKQNSEQ